MDAVQGTISRDKIDGSDDELVAIFPTTPDGVRFLRENNAWGFVSINREPDFVAMYVSQEQQAIQYFAQVDRIVSGRDVELARKHEEYSQFDSSKSVIIFKERSLFELEDMIPYREKIPYSLRYTTLGEFRAATGTNDLF